MRSIYEKKNSGQKSRATVPLTSADFVHIANSRVESGKIPALHLTHLFPVTH
jgi:hypothetical protein